VVAGETVTAALADLLASALLTAVTVTDIFEVAAGAVYIPAELTVPVLPLPPLTPLTFQVTAVFELPLTVALNC
jgi:hypothetical protein